jgi:type I phosphodiesterase/nucleotide pyrophosphatase
VLKYAVPLALLAACPVGRGHDSPEHLPRLVVLVVIDQWPEWSFEAKRTELPQGFGRLLAEGEWHVGRHPSAATLTAPGHALLGSGVATAQSGILANEWWHRDLGVVLKAVEGEDGSVTPKWLRVPALGDAIAAARTGAKAVAVSLKERAAVLPLGHAGESIWYDPKTQAWTTLGAPPAWLAEWNRSHPVAAREREVWTPLDASRLELLSGVPDAQPGEVGEHGFGATFPHDPSATPGQHVHDALFAMPLGNELVFDTAIAAIHGESLGSDSKPDLLVLSLSAHDLVGHGWGHESWEMWDLEMRLDQQLAHFLDELDRTVGADKWAMIVTSDHGASPMPETLGGGRMTHRQIQEAANNAASAVLGAGQWIDNAHYPNVFFSKAMLAQPKSELDSATKRVIYALRSFPGIERVDRVASFAGHCDQRTGDAAMLCLTFDPERSGDLFYLPAKGWIMEDDDEPLATAHGSAHDYDQLVPLILLPPGRARHLPMTAPGNELEMIGVAPMLAHWLGVTPPAKLAR